ncbi:hypothetical protein ACS0TY_028841 [Phlomoides rotata]
MTQDYDTDEEFDFLWFQLVAVVDGIFDSYRQQDELTLESPTTLTPPSPGLLYARNLRNNDRVLLKVHLFACHWKFERINDFFLHVGEELLKENLALRNGACLYHLQGLRPQ